MASTLNKVQQENLDCDITEYIIGGFSRTEIINKVLVQYPKLTDVYINARYTICKSQIQKSVSVSAEKTIELHVKWYETLFRKFDSLDYIAGKNAALRQKEKILGLLKDDNKILIANELNISINKGVQYDPNKLTLEERSRLQKCLGKESASYDLELALKKDIYADSYYEFFKWAFKLLFPNEAYEDNFHIKYLCDLLQKEAERVLRKEEKDQDIIINIPPRTSKSLLISVCFLPWVWIKNPTATFICISFDEDLCNINSRLCRDIIRSEEYQKMYGDRYKVRRDIDGVEMFQNDKGGFRISKTTGSNITGHKGLFILWDDLQNPKTAESKVERKKVVGYYRGSLYNRLTPVNLGIRIGVMQRLHEEDLTGDLLKKNVQGHFHVCLPAEDSKDVKPVELRAFYTNGLLDPIRLNRKTLADFKATLGTRGYTGQYQQTPSPEEGGIFKEEWFDIVYPDMLTRDIANEPIHFFIDSAYTAKTENDPTAILACYLKDNIIYVVDVKQVWMEFPQLMKFIPEYTKNFQISSNSKIYIEPKASGISIAQQLRAGTNLNVIETKAPDTDKVVRANAVSPKAEGKRVKLVYGMYIREYVDQLKAFPNAAHDDMVDTTVNAIDVLLPANNNPDYFFLPM